MEVAIKDVLLPSRKSIWSLYVFGDIHIASIGFDKKHFLRLVKEIEGNPNCGWIFLGDAGECINRKDVRFDQESIRPRYRNNIHRLAQLEAEELKEFFAPIAKKGIAILVGNHEDALRKKYDFDLTWELCNEFGIKNLTSQGYVRLRIGRAKTVKNNYNNVDIFACHGYGNARKWGGRINKIADLGLGFGADIYVMGHQHSCAYVKDIELSLPKTLVGQPPWQLYERVKTAVAVPSFFRTYIMGQDNYASAKLYPPSVVGGAKINFFSVSENSGRNEHIEWNLEI